MPRERVAGRRRTRNETQSLINWRVSDMSSVVPHLAARALDTLREV